MPSRRWGQPDAALLETFNARHPRIPCKITYFCPLPLPSLSPTNLIEHHTAFSGGGKRDEGFTHRGRNVASFVQPFRVCRGIRGAISSGAGSGASIRLSISVSAHAVLPWA